MPLDEGGGVKLKSYTPRKNAMIKTDLKSGKLDKDFGAGIGNYATDDAMGALSEDIEALEIGVVLEVWDPMLMAILAGEI